MTTQVPFYFKTVTYLF